jgi:elongation factor Ts
MLACKDALDEAGGNEDKAIEILRKKGEAQAVKKAGREQNEGAVFAISAGGKAAMVLLRCETDFVARNSDFRSMGEGLVKTLLEKGESETKNRAQGLVPEYVQKLGENISLTEMEIAEAKTLGTYVHTNSKIGVIIGMEGGTEELAHDIAMHAAAMRPSVISPDDVPAESVEKEKEIWREQLKKEGKPEAIWDKIMMGKEKKFREESALLTQPFAKDQNKKVKDILGGAKITAYARLAVGE